uniref:cell division protein FtsL n=1 Tax=Neoroseomonas rubea TaxID=2748666 RepID=UPI003B020C32
MIRPVTLLTLAAAAGAGLWLYQVKHSVSQLDRELREVNRRTEQARERTQVLRAEWALLNEPDRLRQVAQRHLPLEPMAPTQFVRPSEMERRLPPPRQFAGAPSLFAPPEPVGDGRATSIAIAAAATPSPAPRG